MLKIIKIFCTFFFICLPVQAENTAHGKIETLSQIAGSKLQLTLKAKPNNGYMINQQAPWQIELIDKDKKIEQQKTDIQNGRFDLVLHLTETALNRSVQLKVISFYCSEDKKSCFRDVSFLHINQ